MLVAHDLNGMNVFGWDALKGQEYRCPECRNDLLVKQGQIMVHHFAHQPEEACGYGEGESYIHMYMKYQIHRWWPTAELEKVIAPDRRADAVITHDGQQVVVECQASYMGLEEWESRTADYKAIGIPVLWIWWSELLTEHHPPHEYRVKAAMREAADQHNNWLLGMVWPGNLEAWHLSPAWRSAGYVAEHGEPETIRRIRKEALADESDHLPLPIPEGWITGQRRISRRLPPDIQRSQLPRTAPKLTRLDDFKGADPDMAEWLRRHGMSTGTRRRS